eukprot:1958613-Ditylum_brightwellii.AAC.1
MKHDMNAMRAEIISKLRIELKTMVAESTKEAVADVQAERRKYMKSEVKNLVSSVETQLSAIFFMFQKKTSLSTYTQ